MNNFEKDLEKLEELSSSIKKSDITLEEALNCFEEGIKLAKGMEKELDSIEGKIQILMNDNPEKTETSGKKSKKDIEDSLELFNTDTVTNGTRQA